MTMRYNGGQLDGEVDESCAQGEELTAEWDDSQQLYLVYDEDNEPRGAVKSTVFRVTMRPDGTPEFLSNELPKPWHHDRLNLPYAFTFPAIFMFGASGFFATSTRIALLVLAFVLMLTAFNLGAWLWRR